MRDEEIAALVSFIRAQTDKGERLAKDRHWIMDRLFLLQNENPMEAAAIDHFKTRRSFDLSLASEHGEYLAIIACGECHGLDFKGREFPGEVSPPDLIVASAYTPDEFVKLMREGASLSGRDLGMMGEVARDRFGAFTDDEIDALHAFLTDRALKPQAE